MKWKNLGTPQVRTSSFYISYVLNKSLNLKVKGVWNISSTEEKTRVEERFKSLCCLQPSHFNKLSSMKTVVQFPLKLAFFIVSYVFSM
jgi:hypothetical protein